jgi:tetratricopeptide (TPR) repeat protein
MEIPLNIAPSVIFGGLLYLLVFRLAVILLGGLSIWLGYRLFTQALTGRRKTAQGAAEMQAKFGDNELSLKNAAPGLFFSAFGALIVIVVLAGSPPEFKLQQGEGGKVEASMRGDSAADDHDAVWKLHAQALERARQAVEKSSAADVAKKAQYLDTLAGLYFLGDQPQEAIRAQEEALQLLPDNAALQHKLAAYRAALP